MLRLSTRSVVAFTLLEILIAMLIFLLGSTSLCGLWLAVIKIHEEAIDEEQVAFLAQTVIADNQDLHYSKKILKPLYGNKNQNFPAYSYDIIPTYLENGAVLIELKISYRRRGGIHLQIFYTVFYGSQ